MITQLIASLSERFRTRHSDWRPDEPVGNPPRMRRFAGGTWLYREMTPDEQDRYFAEKCLWW